MRMLATFTALLLAGPALGCAGPAQAPVEEASDSGAEPEAPAAEVPRATADLIALLGAEPSDAELSAALAFLIGEDPAARGQKKSRDDREFEQRSFSAETRPALLDQLDRLDPMVARTLLTSIAVESFYIAAPKGINGTIDDRFEPATLELAMLADPSRAPLLAADLSAARSVALMISAPATAEGRLILPMTDTLRERRELCAGQRFVEQPSYEGCSAVLVAPDIVATAGHCVDLAPIETMWFVFRYENNMNATPGVLVPHKDAYRGKQLVERSADDWALIQLDRRVTGRDPVVIRQPPSSGDYLIRGEYVFASGHPDGLPLKIVQSGAILEVTKKRLRTNLDLFEGNSGSPIFERDGLSRQMVGLVVSGRPDYRRRGGCSVVNHCLPKACRPGEFAVPAHLLLARLP